MAYRLTVETTGNVTTSFLVIPIDGSDNAFRLVNSKGENTPGSVEITEGRKKEFQFFDGVWIENGEVTTLVILTKEKNEKIGKLLASEPA